MKKRRLFFLLLLLACTGACRKPDLYLPVNDNPGLSGINDLSQVLIFFKSTGHDTIADLHAGQIITSTHWVVHIDRRLPMKTLVAPLEYLYKRRHKKSMHSKPGTKLYLSYTDTVRRRLSVFDFTEVQIKSPFYTSRTYVKKYPAGFRQKQLVHVFLTPGKLELNGQTFDFPSGKKEVAAHLHAMDTTPEPKGLMFNTDFSVDYGLFNDAYGFLATFDTVKYPMEPYLFIYNPQESAR